MKKSAAWKWPAVPAMVLLGAAQAWSALIIDQQYQLPSGNQIVSIPGASPIGQTFTPALNGIDFATFRLTNFGNTGGSYQAELHTGVNGALLATTSTVSLAGNCCGNATFTGAEVEFDFASLVPLTPGSLYSLIVARIDSSSNFALIGTSPGGYAAGTAIFGGTANPADFFFSEGLRVAAVPEPAAISLVGLGLFAIAARRRKRLSVADD
jgi:hypothetical protein